MVTETTCRISFSYGILLSPLLPCSAEQVPLGGQRNSDRVCLTNDSGSLETAYTKGRMFNSKFLVIPLYISRARESLVLKTLLKHSPAFRRKTLPAHSASSKLRSLAIFFQVADRPFISLSFFFFRSEYFFCIEYILLIHCTFQKEQSKNKTN